LAQPSCAPELRGQNIEVKRHITTVFSKKGC
jgi:hypothetical protein